MCYDGNAQPPPGPAGATHAQDLVLTASDGNRFAAFAAQPETSRGLHQFYRELPVRFGEVCVPTLATDYFGRTAGATGRDESFEIMPHVQYLKMNTLLMDARLARISATGQRRRGSLVYRPLLYRRRSPSTAAPKTWA